MNTDELEIMEDIKKHKGTPITTEEFLDCPLCNKHDMEVTKTEDGELLYFCKSCKTVYDEDLYLRYFLGYPVDFKDER